MNDRSLHQSARDLKSLFEVGSLVGFSDEQLLARFVERREEAVFEMIVRRHGPMVWGVCRRILGDHHDNEDAFQATFLVLARKASSIQVREKLGNWLYGVACQTAMRGRTSRSRRRSRERQVPKLPEPESTVRREDERLPLLDRELSRLPEKYRAPIVLCELEGISHQEAATRLGWPIGTLSGRLSRAKAILKRRLARSDVASSMKSLSATVDRDGLPSVPAGLILATANAARLIAAGRASAVVASTEVAILMEGVLKTMMMTKVKVLVAVVASLGMLAAGSGLLAQQGAGQKSGGGKPLPLLDPAIKQIIEARIETARKVYETTMERIVESNVSSIPEEMANWSRRWMEEELRLRTVPVERLVSIHDHLERTRRLEEMTKNYAASGQGRSEDALKVKFFRLEAEEMLLEFRSAHPDVTLPTPKAPVDKVGGAAPVAAPPPPPRSPR